MPLHRVPEQVPGDKHPRIFTKQSINAALNGDYVAELLGVFSHWLSIAFGVDNPGNVDRRSHTTSLFLPGQATVRRQCCQATTCRNCRRAARCWSGKVNPP